MDTDCDCLLWEEHLSGCRGPAPASPLRDLGESLYTAHEERQRLDEVLADPPAPVAPIPLRIAPAPPVGMVPRPAHVEPSVEERPALKVPKPLALAMAPMQEGIHAVETPEGLRIADTLEPQYGAKVDTSKDVSTSTLEAPKPLRFHDYRKGR
jgi:hypothetical protein